MQLDKYDQALLDGEHGETKQKMMEILVGLGKMYDAERLIEVKNVQVSGASYKTIGDSGIEWLNSLEGKAVVPSFLNPIGIPRTGWDIFDISQDFVAKQQLVTNAYIRLGIRPTCTCTPYYFTLIERGDHLAWAESSAVIYANSVLGARTNREGGPSALASALTGKTPEYGLHIVKNRLPTIEFCLANPEDAKLWTEAEYGAFGIIAGAIAGNKIPLIKGIRPKSDMLKAMGAAMAASGAVALFHVEDITPEARFPFFKKNFEEQEREVVTIETAEIHELFSNVIPDAVAIGCPHLSENEVLQLATLLDGKRVIMPFYVFAAAEQVANHHDLFDKIGKSGALIVPDTCMIVSPILEGKTVMTNSGKAFTYLPGMCNATPRLGTLEDCVKVACGDI